jgi:thymidylate kinase
MFTAALIGPDGAGKTTVGRRLEATLTVPVRYLYMGVNVTSGSVVLPTTRLIRQIRRVMKTRAAEGTSRETASAPHLPRRGPAAVLTAMRAGLRLANLLAEECLRSGLARYHRRRGEIVLFDRWSPADYTASDARRAGMGESRSERIHRAVLQRLCPRPDLVIYLDAPAEVLFAREGEGTLEQLEYQRQQYLKLRGILEPFVTVDASRPTDAVVRDVAGRIEAFYRERADRHAALTRAGMG